MYTHIYIHIYIPTKKPASEGKPPRLVKPATAKRIQRQTGSKLFGKKKRKRKTLPRLKIQRTSLSVCTTTSRATSSDDIITFVHAHEYLHFPTRPLFYRSSGPRWKKEVPLNSFFEKNPNTLLQRPRFSNLFFFYSTEKVKSPRNCARALKSSA